MAFNKPTQVLFVREVNNIRFEWHGGPYIDIFSRAPMHPDQEMGFWINNATIRPSGWYITDVNIGVWDYEKDKLSIPVTKKAFDLKIDEWLKDNS